VPRRQLPPPGPAFYPVGVETLTFLFTDVEGSTAQLGRLGDDDYARVLAGHHALIRSALAAHAGREIDTQGDAFFAVFSSPRACVAAVLQMQQAFAAYGWPGGERVRVRMGSIAGRRRGRPPAWWAWRCTGPPGGRGRARGQVLVSEAAAVLVRDGLPEGVALADLGVHRLKDLGRPEQIFQLTAAALPGQFPPLRSLGNPALANRYYASSESAPGPSSTTPWHQCSRTAETARRGGALLAAR
jgi:class 3 adenylate cyclase